MGFDGLFFSRADYQDIQTRNSTKTMEMLWKASANLGKLLTNDCKINRSSTYISDRQSWLFTGIMPHGYGSPSTFCFDYRCTDDPIMVSKILIGFFASFTSIYIHYRMMSVCMIITFQSVYKHLFKLLEMRFLSYRISKKNDYPLIF
jgi:hypothetical protein